MSIHAEIIEWLGNKSELWREAVNRIIVKNQLTDDDIKDLVDINKSEVLGKIDDSKKVDMEALKSLAESIDGSKDVVINKIYNTKNISALKEGVELTFEQKGLTVVYGDNGTGKSSYTSILKHVCNTRGDAPSLNHNLFIKGSEAKKNTAEVEYFSEGENGVVILDNDKVNDNILKAVDVFDTSSAKHYIDGENEIAFIPQGLSILEELVSAIDKVREHFVAEKETLILKKFSYESIFNDYKTPSAEVIKNISSKTSDRDINSLIISKEEEKEIEKIEKELNELKKIDPKNRIRENESKIRRFTPVRDKLERIDKAFIEKEFQRSADIIKKYQDAKETSKIASKEAFGDLSVKNIGANTWKQLWEAARKFYENSTEESFPNTSDDSFCPLCLQDLQEEAKIRFNSFEEYVKNDAEKKLIEYQKEVEVLKNNFLEIDLNFEDTKPIINELNQLSEGFDVLFTKFIDVKSELKKSCVERIYNYEDFLGIEKVKFISPIKSINEIIDELEKQNQSLKEESVDEQIKEATLKLAELKVKELIKKHQKELLCELKRLEQLSLIEECVKKLNTSRITSFSNNLSKKHISDSLKEKFEAELKGFGFRYLEIVQDTKGIKGKQYNFLKLSGNYDTELPLKEVLSEGEHRCISLATFFSELAISEHKSAIAFDDPVSSLDHKWRRRIAKRIVEESINRQVIVFTHDITFALELDKFAKEESSSFSMRGLTRKPTETGIILENLPWELLDIKKRIKALREDYKWIERKFNDLTEEEYKANAKEFYRKMRITMESMVERLILNESIKRFGTDISTQRLKKVINFSYGDYQIVDSIMSTGSLYFRGHDNSPAMNQVIPTIEDLQEDITKMEEFKKKLDGWS